MKRSKIFLVVYSITNRSQSDEKTTFFRNINLDKYLIIHILTWLSNIPQVITNAKLGSILEVAIVYNSKGGLIEI